MFDQILNSVLGPATTWLQAHPKVLAAMVVFIVVHTAIKAFVDSLVSSRAQWDKTPMTDDTWYEKALTISVRALAVVGKFIGYLAGFRPKPKAEIKAEEKK